MANIKLDGFYSLKLRFLYIINNITLGSIERLIIDCK